LFFYASKPIYYTKSTALVQSVGKRQHKLHN